MNPLALSRVNLVNCSKGRWALFGKLPSSDLQKRRVKILGYYHSAKTQLITLTRTFGGTHPWQILIHLYDWQCWGPIVPFSTHEGNNSPLLFGLGAGLVVMEMVSDKGCPIQHENSYVHSYILVKGENPVSISSLVVTEWLARSRNLSRKCQDR